MLDEIESDARARMGKSIENLRQDLQHLRTGRASIALVDHIKVDYYGNETPLNQVATVAASDSRTLTITPFEKTMIGVVEKALLGSDVGVTPTVAGMVIRLNMPTPTEERRKELAKHVSHEAENAKIAVRNIRRDALHQVKELLKSKDITEDESRQAEDAIQKHTDASVKNIDVLAKAKEDELMAL